MKKLLFFTVALLAVVALSAKGQPKKECFLDASGKPTQTLFDLLSVFSVKHDQTLSGIVQETQKIWLRPQGKELWEFEDTYAHKKHEVMPIVTRAGFISEKKPQKKMYDYVFVMGATLYRIRTRLVHLISLWKQGIRFRNIILLGGQRTLDPVIEAQEKFMHSNVYGFEIRKDWSLKDPLPKTEIAMMKVIFDQAVLPDDMKKISVTYVDAPLNVLPDGTTRRPSAGDTVNTWLKNAPKPGSVLVMANQPYCAYLNSIIKTFLPDGFSIDTVGHELTDFSDKVGILLDTIARYLYQENKRLITKNKEKNHG